MNRMNSNPFADYAEAPPSEHEWICRQEEIDAREKRIAKLGYPEMPTRMLRDGTQVPAQDGNDE